MTVTIVGAGLAGLAAAVELNRAGQQVRLFEASDGVGGRVRTDVIDGRRLDRGFQILLSGYPEAQAILDYAALDLQPFAPGALVRYDGAFHRVGDPLREPTKLLETIRAPVGSLLDKAKVLKFRRDVERGSLADLWSRPETTARQRLDEAGFSPAMIDRFLGPLFAGITLDPDLGGSSRVLEFVFRMLAAGDAVVPAEGMGAIADYLVGQLPEDTVTLSTPVASVTQNEVVLHDGQRSSASQVIAATGLTAASGLTGIETRPWRGVTSVWFAAPESPIAEPVLALNGEGTEPINSMAVMSRIAPNYGAAGQETIVVSSPRIEPNLVAAMRKQLTEWFGSVSDTWEVLRVDEIERAQPSYPVGHLRTGAFRHDDGVWICGDHASDPSINGALESGRMAAKAIVGGKAS